MVYKAIEYILYDCPDMCPHFKGEHQVCHTPFIIVDFENYKLRPYFNQYCCCSNIKKKYLVVNFETEKERDDFNKNNKTEHVFNYSNILFDFNYFLKLKEDAV